MSDSYKYILTNAQIDELRKDKARLDYLQREKELWFKYGDIIEDLRKDVDWKMNHSSGIAFYAEKSALKAISLANGSKAQGGHEMNYNVSIYGIPPETDQLIRKIAEENNISISETYRWMIEIGVARYTKEREYKSCG